MMMADTGSISATRNTGKIISLPIRFNFDNAKPVREAMKITSITVGTAIIVLLRKPLTKKE
jgi:hypothetical protein